MLPVAHQNFRTVVCWTSIQPEKYTPRNLVRHVLKFDKITLTVELGYATCTLVGYEFKQNHSIQSIDGRYLYSIDYTMKLSVCQPISSVLLVWYNIRLIKIMIFIKIQQRKNQWTKAMNSYSMILIVHSSTVPLLPYPTQFDWIFCG